MFSVSLVCLAGLLFSVKYTAAFTSSQPTATSTSPSPTHTVEVGLEGLVFTPNQLFADVGDILEFKFYPQNHSVARSDYKSPCIPYEDIGLNKTGFWSGFVPVAVSSNDPPKFRVRVNDTAPIWFYSAQTGSCIENGMIGVVNANATETFDTQLEFAKNSTLMFTPGQDFPSEIVTKPSGPSTTTTFTPTPTAPVTVSRSSSGSAPLSPTVIAGISVAAVVVLVITCILLYICLQPEPVTEIIGDYKSTVPSSLDPPHFGTPHLSPASSFTYPPKPQYDSKKLASPYLREAQVANNRSIESSSGHTLLGTEHEESEDIMLPIQSNVPPPPPPSIIRSSGIMSPHMSIEEPVFHPFYTDVPGPLRLIRSGSGSMQSFRGEPLELSGGTPTSSKLERNINHRF